MSQLCPACQHQLSSVDNGFHCESCGADFVPEARCPDCHQPLQVLKACGAVDYFCEHGHGLISKRRVEFFPVT